jgi:anti-sigma regulatory factor (Ser/Thr protein kinase)
MREKLEECAGAFSAKAEFITVTQTSDLVRQSPHSSQFIELEQSLQSRVEHISPFADQLMQFIKPLTQSCRDDNISLDIEIALQEALANAVIHGNRNTPHKRVRVTCRCSVDGEISITVRDEGQGFDSSAVPDPTDRNNFLLSHGRGIHLMKALMDEVSFEDNGTLDRQM